MGDGRGDYEAKEGLIEICEICALPVKQNSQETPELGGGGMIALTAAFLW